MPKLFFSGCSPARRDNRPTGWVRDTVAIKILNLSGHRVRTNQIRCLAEGEKPLVLDVDVVNVDATQLGLEDAIRAALLPHKGEIADSRINYLIPPGYAPWTLAAIAWWHGVAGHFPKILVAQRGDEGFHFTEIIDLQTFRDLGRVRRR